MNILIINKGGFKSKSLYKRRLDSLAMLPLFIKLFLAKSEVGTSEFGEMALSVTALICGLSIAAGSYY